MARVKSALKWTERWYGAVVRFSLSATYLALVMFLVVHTVGMFALCVIMFIDPHGTSIFDPRGDPAVQNLGLLHGVFGAAYLMVLGALWQQVDVRGEFSRAVAFAWVPMVVGIVTILIVEPLNTISFLKYNVTLTACLYGALVVGFVAARVFPRRGDGESDLPFLP